MQLPLRILPALVWTVTGVLPACTDAPSAATDAGVADAAPADPGSAVAGDAPAPGDVPTDTGGTAEASDSSVAEVPAADVADADEFATTEVDIASLDSDAAEPDGADAVSPPQCVTAGDCPGSGPCTTALCVGGKCSTSPKSDGVPCTAADACAWSSSCTAGACKPKQFKVCDDLNPCTVDQCDPATGLCGAKPAAAGPCDDGNPCTTGDACASDGSCKGGVNACGACKSNYDCALKDDGNACNGTLYCNDAVKPAVCAILAGSVPVCAATTQPCGANICQPQSGLCAWTPAADGTACEDGNPCTQDDACASGQCKGGTALACGCASDQDCPDDGNLCNGIAFCNKATGSCALNPATVKSCPASGVACQANSCDAKTGACVTKNLPDGTLCSDDKPATKGDVCTKGVCAGTDVYACKADGDCANFEDGDFCNGTLFCNKASGLCEINGATGVVCPSVDDTACLKNICQPKSGKCAKTPVADGVVCNDGNPCSQSDVCAKGQCLAGTNTCGCQTDAECAGKDDGNLCNGTLFCDKSAAPFSCKLNPATTVVCPSVDDGPCAANVCEPKTGKCAVVTQPDGKSCDADGNPCTGGDSCAGGQCKPGGSVCECQSDADCAAKDDGDLCNGTLYCDKAQKKCLPNPATVVFCTKVNDTACSKNVCLAKTGQCATTAVNQGLPCEDGNPLTVSDVCDAGSCAAGSPSKPCQADAECQGSPNLCVAMYCDATGSGVCQVDTAKTVQCAKPGAGACAVEVCQPSTGKCAAIALPDKAFCSAGTKCAAPGTCKLGVCAPGKAANCDDINPCTLDTCDVGVGCVHSAAAEGATCNDGNACTDGDVCGNGQCNGALVKTDDGNACTTDSCKPLDGVSHLPLDATSCDDGNACTGGDTCAKGTCKAGAAAVDCDDKIACTDDSCDPKKGCVHVGKAGGSCDDGSKCTVGDACAIGICTGSPKNCDDSDACTTDACDKDKGCQYEVAAGAVCDDGDACTVGDKCNGLGKCGSSTKKNCNDNNLCTLDSCDPAQGCVQTPTAGPCDDGSACSDGDACSNGKCGGKPLVCNDNNPCTLDGCEPAKGCAALPQDGSPCDDNNACTEKDGCAGGACVGTALSCDDANPCTKDSCDKTESCKHAVTDAAACDDGSACTEADTCVQAKCVGKDRLWLKTFAMTTSQQDQIEGVAVAPDGAAVAVGWRFNTTQFGTWSEPTLQRIDRNGNQVWSKVLAKDATNHAATSVVAVGNGFMTAGWEDTLEFPWESDTGKDVLVRLYDENGTEKAGKKLVYGGHQLITHSALLSDGAVGHCGNDTGNKGFYLRSKPGGAEPSWTYNVASPSGNGLFAGAVAAENGSFWCVGAAYGSPDKLWLAKFSSNGTVLANKAISPVAGVVWIGQRALLAPDGLVVTGVTTWNSNGKSRAFVAKIKTSDYSAQWVSVLPLDHITGRGIADLGGGNYGVALLTIEEFQLFAVANASGFMAPLGGYSEGGRSVADAVFSPELGWTVAGWKGSGGNADGFVARADVFGNAGCATSGACTAKAYGACVDALPCTVDQCSASKSCFSAPAADGTLCGAGKECKSATCQ